MVRKPRLKVDSSTFSLPLADHQALRNLSEYHDQAAVVTNRHRQGERRLKRSLDDFLCGLSAGRIGDDMSILVR